MVVLTAVKGAADYVREITSNRFVTRMEADLQGHMFRQLVGTDLARLQTEAPAGLAARFSSDIALVGGAVRGLLGGLTGLLIMIVTFAVMLTIDWPLTLAMILIFGLAVLPVNLIGSRLRKLSRRTQAEVATMTSEVTEGLSGIRMARTYRLEEPLAENAESVFERLFGLKNKQNRWSARVSPMMEALAGRRGGDHAVRGRLADGSRHDFHRRFHRAPDRARRRLGSGAPARRHLCPDPAGRGGARPGVHAVRRGKPILDGPDSIERATGRSISRR